MVFHRCENTFNVYIMFLMYFLDNYINLVKYLQRVALDVFLNWRYLHQDAGQTYSEVSNMSYTGSIQK